MDGCERPLHNPRSAEREPDVLHRCALHEIASYNWEELVEWGEENAADMVKIARDGLAAEQEVSSRAF